MFEALVVQTAGYVPVAVTEPPYVVGGLESLVLDVEAVGFEEARDGAVDEIAAGMADMILEGLSEHVQGDPVQCSVSRFWRFLIQV